ncbi:B-box type zinc finger family protein, partial [Prunus dulcis]
MMHICVENADQWVHEANFLALRHVRCLLCNTCQNLTQRYVVRISVEVMLPTILSWAERKGCSSNNKRRRSTTLKRPFLF